MGLSLWHLFKVSARKELLTFCMRRFLNFRFEIFFWCAQQSGLLGVNSLLILNRRRFLAKYGLDDLQHAHASGNAMKVQAVGLLHAVQYLKVCLRSQSYTSSWKMKDFVRLMHSFCHSLCCCCFVQVPVIIANIIVIIFEILIGG